MIIIETCPKCGHDLLDLMLACNPPIPQKKCFSCGWSWTGKPEEVTRVPFGGNSFVPDTTNYLNNFLQSTCINCPSNPKNGGDGICFCILGQQ